MASLLEAVKQSDSATAKEAIVSALQTAIAENAVAAVKAATAYCCGGGGSEGGYCGAAIEEMYKHVTGGATTASSPQQQQQALGSTIAAAPFIALAIIEAMAEYFVVEKEQLKRAVTVLQPLVSPSSSTLSAAGGATTDASSSGRVPDEIMIRATIKLVELFCFAGEFQEAEGYMARCAKFLRYSINTAEGEGRALKTRFICAQAQVYEHRRRFADAAARFYEVSLNDAEQAKEALTKAALCGVLAEPSDIRTRIVAGLANDERTQKLLGTAFASVIAKVSQMRFLRPNEAAILQQIADDEGPTAIANQIASSSSSSSEGGNEWTILQASLLAHNIKAVSLVYDNIGISELAALVNASDKTEDVLRVVASMISGNKINGTIDQLEDVVTFHNSKDDAVMRADQQIALVCNAAAQVYESIRVAHPELCRGN